MSVKKYLQSLRSDVKLSLDSSSELSLPLFLPPHFFFPLLPSREDDQKKGQTGPLDDDPRGLLLLTVRLQSRHLKDIKTGPITGFTMSAVVVVPAMKEGRKGNLSLGSSLAV